MNKFYFFVDNHNVERGPVNIELISEHGINGDTLVWFDSMPLWVKASSVPDLKPYITNKGIESIIDKLPPLERENTRDKKIIPPQFRVIDDKLKAQINMMTPKSWLIESVLVTIFCFLPAGIVGIIYASKVNPLWYSGKYAESLRASTIAGRWVKWTFLIIFTLWVIWIAFILLFPQSFKTVDFYNSYFDW